MPRVVLFQPEIPPNTGNVARSCAATCCELHLIDPLGFEISDRNLRRAGLDYWPWVQLHRHGDWQAFRTQQQQRGGRLLALSRHASSPYHRQHYRHDDWLLFGRESSGLPEAVLAREIVHNSLDLGRRRVREVMRPRREIVALDLRRPIWECLRLADDSRYSRFPLSDGGDLDRLVGVVRTGVPLGLLQSADRSLARRSLAAVVLVALTLGLFAWRQGAARPLLARLRPWPGLLLTALVALPWYALMLVVDGAPFWNSFFGYHNLQRFTAVVNHHLQPWWFFLPVLVVASLPFTPLLLAGLSQALRGDGGLADAAGDGAARSLPQFAACWLLAVLIFFTVAATKLPSYWIPATPAAGLLIAWAGLNPALLRGRAGGWWRASVLALLALFTAGLAASSRWIPLIHDPELPTLPAELLASGDVLRAAACFGLALVLALLLGWGPGRWRPFWLLGPQLGLVLFVLIAHLPMVRLGDRVRQLPVRQVAADVVALRRPAEPLAMVGILKPSLHYYARQVVLFEGVQPNGPVNLNDRLALERRPGLRPGPVTPEGTLLLVIDETTAKLPHWSGLPHLLLAHHGLYTLWRVQRSDLARHAGRLQGAGIPGPDWQRPRPERY